MNPTTMINAGKYRHLIAIRNPAADSSRDDFGGRKGSGATVASVYASKEDWNGSELDESGRQTAIVTTRWKTRYRTDVLPKMQIVHGEDVYNIMSVLDFDGTQRELTIESRKVVS
jgi:SPP1 family predicted phage head-tail adaptor